MNERPWWFVKYVRISENGCWIWYGSLDKYGYGQFRQDERIVRAHRMSYEYFKCKKLTPDILLHHQKTCPKNCINPDHLIETTRFEHEDAPSTVNRGKNACPLGHAYDYVHNNGRYKRRHCLTCIDLKRKERERKRLEQWASWPNNLKKTA